MNERAWTLTLCYQPELNEGNDAVVTLIGMFALAMYTLTIGKEIYTELRNERELTKFEE